MSESWCGDDLFLGGDLEVLLEEPELSDDDLELFEEDFGIRPLLISGWGGLTGTVEIGSPASRSYIILAGSSMVVVAIFSSEAFSCNVCVLVSPGSEISPRARACWFKASSI